MDACPLGLAGIGKQYRADTCGQSRTLATRNEREGDCSDCLKLKTHGLLESMLYQNMHVVLFWHNLGMVMCGYFMNCHQIPQCWV